MANHCINKVRVVGIKGETLEKIMNIFKSDEFEYDKPVDTEFDDKTGWAFDCVRSKPNEVFFFTRWSPPTYFIEQLSAKYPKAMFNMMYVEGGMELYGHEKYKNGEMYWENDLLFNTGRHTADFSRRLWRNYEIALNYDNSTGGLR